MSVSIQFGIISDIHIGLPQTIDNHPNRFHLVEVSIPALEQVLEHLESFDLDFLLIPGDLTQDGEIDNHQWLGKRLAKLPFPVYVVPGNHDVPNLLATESSIGFHDFPKYYQECGYHDRQELYYSQEIFPGIQLIALNSNQFDGEGNQIGWIDEQQLLWLENTLEKVQDKLVLVMIHHNVIEHLPGQSQHPLGKRYMLGNAPYLLQILNRYGVKLIFTGHLHVQDIAETEGIYEICTGSLVSYPHPYRVAKLNINNCDRSGLQIESHRVTAVKDWENLAHLSREWMGDRSFPFMMKLLTSPPLNLSVAEAEKYAPQLRYFWADIAEGDKIFDFPPFPPQLQNYFQRFSAISKISATHKLALIDNRANILI
jgi:3',5'-cyclic AMP phosphodiesterase CpdA